MLRPAIALAATTLLLALPARAEVVDSQPGGFASRHVVTVQAPREKVYATLMDIATWWNPSHSWSGKAENLSLNLADHCFCEALPKGSVRHMEIVYVDGRGALHLAGALGPLQTTGASGHLNFALKDAKGVTELTVTYDVGGYAQGGLGPVWAAPVDGVIGEQVGRLKARVEAQP